MLMDIDAFEMSWCYIYILFFLRFSVSNDLKYDAERDLRDIGAKNIQVHSLNKVSQILLDHLIITLDFCAVIYFFSIFTV